MTSKVMGKWQKFWQDHAVYKWDENASRKESFVIDTPPPTVSGTLHMGHVFSYAQTDFIARFQRMHGKNVFYPMGWDDNGLPTERLVEKEKGIQARSMPRYNFAALCEDVIQNAIVKFKNLWQELGLSVDWRQEYHTIDVKSQRFSQLSFIDLYEKGHMYHSSGPTFWDCVDRTALAQTDIEDKEVKGVMYDIAFKVIDSDAEIVISTTRPELLGACSAIFYHPDDERYAFLEGQRASVPIFEFSVDIVPDTDVSIEKGTGLVMCCTFGDIQDIDWWKRHHLPLRSCVNEEGCMINSGKYDGMKVLHARDAIIADLREIDRIKAESDVIKHVKCAERSGAMLEIIITKQWYVSVLKNREKILAMGNQCNWHPAHMKVRFDNWVDGLNQDWCISRQRFFGVPIPVWYSKREGEEGKVLLPAISSLPVDPMRDLPSGYSRDEVIPDSDVMDTWATSALTPQLSSCAINQKYSVDWDRHQKLFPFDLRPQGHEIIRTWAFTTIVKSLYHDNTLPWKNVVLSGWCLASDKKKMSKSKGNAARTPEDVLSEFGPDVVRYWASNVKLGADITYSEDAFKIGKKLVTKLMNAVKFCNSHFPNMKHRPISPSKDVRRGVIYEAFDMWLLDNLYHVVERATVALERYEYSQAKHAIDEFFWKILCDNYLELVKNRIYNAYDEPGGQSAIVTLYHAVNTILRLFAPFIPYIAEELYQDFRTCVDAVISALPASANVIDKGAQKAKQNEDVIVDKYAASIHAKGMWPKRDSHCQCSIGVSEQCGYGIEIMTLLRRYKSSNCMSVGAKLSEVEVHAASGFMLSDSLLNDIKCSMKIDAIAVKAVYKGEELLEEWQDGKESRIDVDRSACKNINLDDCDRMYVRHCEDKGEDVAYILAESADFYVTVRTRAPQQEEVAAAA